MKKISRIEIQYFRSIYWTTITDINELNVFTGRNDAGKSNVLKALNLFFNNSVYDGVKFDFQENFNKLRYEQVRKDSVKGKQFIQIRITFNRGEGMSRTLPEQFTVTKKWLRYDDLPIVSDDLQRQCAKAGLNYNDRTKSSLTKFLNAIDYIYIPAIKDKSIFSKILNRLQGTLYNEKLTKDKKLVDSLKELSTNVQSAAEELNSEFYNETGISTRISSPQDITDFYSTLSIDTVYGDIFSIKLDNRGDGIRVRYLPSILNYLAINSKKTLIWGFEEPENSVEYNLAIKMARSFAEDYAKASMIFLTSHSPAFINLAGENIQLYRCFNEDNKTLVLTDKKARDRESLEAELGYLKLQEQLYEEYLKKKQELDNSLSDILKLKELISAKTLPVLVTEGKSDVSILKTAWVKLYPNDPMPFEICSCDATGDGQSAGCDMLKSYLTSYRYDADHIVIGLFDRDNNGLKAYELSNNFSEDSSKLFKKSKNNKAFAMLLPNIESKKEFVEYNNFCIEFMFDKEYLDIKVNDKGLVLNHGSIIEMINGITVTKKLSTELWFCKIESSSKCYFAESVVPTLPPEAFDNFKPLFEIVKKIIAE